MASNSPKEQKKLAAAFALLRESQFDEAKTAFEAILQKSPENAEAYWGRFRARYHIT
jgi:thioredoxin-like negative regulator of GroEL